MSLPEFGASMRRRVSARDRAGTRWRSEGLVSVDVKVTVLVGGVGGARFLLGVQNLLRLGQFSEGDEA